MKKNYANIDSEINVQYQLTDKDLERLHSVILDMYKDLKEVCDKYNLRVIAGGGTALGAIRHGGFIPWDDDMDLAFTRDDFEKLKSIFDEELGDKYYLLAPGAKNGANCFLARMMKKGTTLLNMIDELAPYPHCIYIDFTTLDYVPNNRVTALVKGLLSDTLRFGSYSAYWAKYKSESLRNFMVNSEGRYYYKIRILIGTLFNLIRTPEEWFSTYDKFIQGKRSKRLTFAAGRKKYRGEILPYSKCMPLRKVPFADTEIYLLNDVDYYLKRLYGNYMKIPDENNRERHLCLKIDFEREV